MIAAAWSLGQVLEAGMLVCFGISWPVDILKTLRTHRTEGKSAAFMSLVLTGYLFGMAAKLMRAVQAGIAPETVTVLYALNATLIAVDIALYYRFRAQSPAAPGEGGQ